MISRLDQVDRLAAWLQDRDVAEGETAQEVIRRRRRCIVHEQLRRARSRPNRLRRCRVPRRRQRSAAGGSSSARRACPTGSASRRPTSGKPGPASSRASASVVSATTMWRVIARSAAVSGGRTVMLVEAAAEAIAEFLHHFRRTVADHDVARILSPRGRRPAAPRRTTAGSVSAAASARPGHP